MLLTEFVGGKSKRCIISYQTTGGNSVSWGANSVDNNVPFNTEEYDPDGLVTLDQGNRTFTLIPGDYEITCWWGNFVTTGWGGNWNGTNSLLIGSTRYDIEQGNYLNGAYYPKSSLGGGVPVNVQLTSSTVCSLVFTQSRSAAEFFTSAAGLNPTTFYTVQCVKIN